jgi:hypothetical protein
MHRISQMDYSDCFCEYVTDNTKAEMERLRDEYNRESKKVKADRSYDPIEPLEVLYLRLLYNCPTGVILTAGMSTNYQQLKTIYSQRQNHRLPEWREFCKWIESLPCSEIITGEV